MILARLLACAPQQTWDSTYDPTPDDDTGDVVVLDCSGDWITEPPELTTGDGAAPVLRLRTGLDASTRVTYGVAGGETYETAWSETGTEHEAFLLGVPLGADFSWRVELAEVNDCTAEGSATAGTVPSGVPELVQSEADEDAIDSSFLVAPIIGGESGRSGWVAILDPAGELVFAQPLVIDGVDAPTFRATPALDGDGLWVLEQALDADSPGYLHRLRLDGSWAESITVTGLHTDFVEIEEGRFAGLTWELRDIDGKTVLGDRVLVVEADGSVSTVWNAFDNIEFDPNGDWQQGFYAADPQAWDWTHVNGIGADPGGGVVYITMAAYSAVARIDLASSSQSWIIGDGIGDFDVIAGPDPATSFPHSVQSLGDDKLVVFNRGNLMADPDTCSWGAELKVDAETREIATDWTIEADDCLLVAFLGQARLLEGGTVELDWSSSGRVEEYETDGTLLRRLDLSIGSAFGFTTRLER